MAEARKAEAWSHTSHLLAMIHNRIPGLAQSEMLTPDELNPLARKKAGGGGDDDIEVPFDTLKLLVKMPVNA
jgi:hypothetical protein